MAVESALIHPEPHEIDVITVLRALADPTRLEIVHKLARAEPRELTCSDFECATKQLLTHHLRTLRDAGVTRTREEGRYRYIRLRRDLMEMRFPGLLDLVLQEGARQAHHGSHDGGRSTPS